MQNLDTEIVEDLKRSEDNLFVSDEIKDLISFEDIDVPSFPSLQVALVWEDVSLKFNLLKHAKKKSKIQFDLLVHKKDLTASILCIFDSAKEICMFLGDDVVKKYIIDPQKLNYTIKNKDQNTYKIKLTLRKE